MMVCKILQLPAILKCPIPTFSWVKREMREAEKEIELQERDEEFSFGRRDPKDLFGGVLCFVC